MSLESLVSRDFWDNISKYADFLVKQGVDLDKVRFVSKPNFIYDYEENIVYDNTTTKRLFDGKVVDVKKNITLSCDAYDVTNVDLAHAINNTNLGVVLYVDNLVKTYDNGEWVLIFNMAFLDEKLSVLNDYDDIINLNTESLTDKINDIKEYFETNLEPLTFIIINPVLHNFITQQENYNPIDKTFCELQLKVNNNLKEDIISLSSLSDSFYLKITNE